VLHGDLFHRGKKVFKFVGFKVELVDLKPEMSPARGPSRTTASGLQEYRSHFCRLVRALLLMKRWGQARCPLSLDCRQCQRESPA